MEKIVSIIVPIYNVENQLKRCLDSIVKQSYPHLEIILVDDGSTDGSAKVCQSFLKEDERITYYKKKNGGLSDARNYGIEKSTGDYILFVDSDDYIDTHAVKVLISEVIIHDLDIVCANSIVEIGEKTEKGIKVKAANENIMTGEEYLACSLKIHQYASVVCINLYASKIIKDKHIKFVKDILHEDEAWMPRVLLSARRVKFINYCFYHYVLREGSLTQKEDLSKNIQDVMQICEDLEKYYLQNRSSISSGNLRILKNHLVELYISRVSLDVKYIRMYRKQINRKFLIRNSKMMKTRLRTCLFIMNPYFYLKCIDIKNKLLNWVN